MVDPSAETIVNAKQSLEDKLKLSLDILRDAFKRYRSDQMFISFNGGKDCTVLLHLVQTVISELRNESSSGPDDVLCLYLQPANPFDEVEVFVAQCATEYSVNLLKTPSGSKTKQESLFEVCDRNPELKACLMGCRRSDPWCDKLHHFEKTTKGWPDLMRVNPLLDWTCADIWDYIQANNVAYCSLYDVGYTSLGEKTNTLPNPHLQFYDEATGETGYRPAHMLKHSDELERIGRFVLEAPKKASSSSANLCPKIVH